MVSRYSDPPRNQEQNVIFNKNATSNSSPQVVLREKGSKIAQKPTSSTENLLTSHDMDTAVTDFTDMPEEVQTEFAPTNTGMAAESKRKSSFELERMSSVVDIEKLKQGHSDVNVAFPKEQV